LLIRCWHKDQNVKKLDLFLYFHQSKIYSHIRCCYFKNDLYDLCFYTQKINKFYFQRSR
jgi:hypothetical protein